MGEGLDDAVASYVSSADDDAVIAQYDILGSMAHVVMLHDRKIISRADAGAILAALSRISASPPEPHDGAEDIHELIEADVIRKAGKGAGGRMHTARSRNDQVSLDIRLKLRDDVNDVCTLAIGLAEAMAAVASAHKKTVMPLYTHMQQAQYGTLSHYMIAHIDALMRDVERLSSAYTRINQCPLGAGAVGGTSLNIDRRQVARLLGFGGIVENALDATGSRDHVAEYVAAIAIMMSGLSRIAEDIAIWSTSEFSFVELGGSVSSPSSVLPQKKNPDVLELTRGKAAETLGGLVTTIAATKGLASGYSRDLQQSKLAAWAATRTAVGALAILRTAISGMSVNVDRMAEAARSGDLDALEIAEILVAGGNVPFRSAHMIVGRLVKSAHASGVGLGEVGDRAVSIAVRGTGVSVKDLRSAIGRCGALASLRRRGSMGSSGYAEQARMTRARLRSIPKYRREVDMRRSAVSEAYAVLGKRVRALGARRKS